MFGWLPKKTRPAAPFMLAVLEKPIVTWDWEELADKIDESPRRQIKLNNYVMSVKAGFSVHCAPDRYDMTVHDKRRLRDYTAVEVAIFHYPSWHWADPSKINMMCLMVMGEYFDLNPRPVASNVGVDRLPIWVNMLLKADSSAPAPPPPKIVVPTLDEIVEFTNAKNAEDAKRMATSLPSATVMDDPEEFAAQGYGFFGGP